MPDHRDLTELDAAASWELLRSAPVARVGFIDHHGDVDVLPVNHLVHDGTVAWLSAAGSKLAAAAQEQLVALEADAVDESTRTAWSVVVRGRARIVTHPVRERELYGQDVAPWTAADRRVFWVELDEPVISGRRLS